MSTTAHPTAAATSTVSAAVTAVATSTVSAAVTAKAGGLNITALAVPVVFIAMVVFVIGEIIKRVYSIPTWSQLCAEINLLCCPRSN